MADQRASRGKKDRTRIDLDDDHELRYWARKFDVSRTDLKRAVDRVGVVAKDVAAYLGKAL